MKIYESERLDGLEEIVSKQTSIACFNIAKVCNPFDSAHLNTDKIFDLIKDNKYKLAQASNKDQIDLFYLQSILVSTGWNKNDDVFDPKETWNARKTPEDKPFNFMHNEKDIIGHITGNVVVDFNGNTISDESDVPDSFNIITNAVIYKCWSDIEQRERIDKITAEINEGKWFVSMECLFPAFDYALIDQDGNSRVVERNEASAFLTKHLRAYGGDGLYENYKIGRLLRNLSFSGKGLVSKPANPRSIILDGNKFFDESKSQILTVSLAKENSMSLENKVAELQAELAQAKLENKQLMEQFASEKETDYQSKIQALESLVNEKTQEIQNLSQAKEALTLSVKELEEAAEAAKHEMYKKDEEMKKKDEEMAGMKKKAAMMKRKAQLQEIGFDAEEASATVESFDSIDDESFDKIVALWKKKGMKKEDMKKKEEMTEASVNEEVLDQAEPVEEVAVAQVEEGVDQAESLRAVASEWLASVLQTVPKNK